VPEDLERFDPLGPPLRRIALEHRSRYRFAEALAPGARTLDLGCGEGYGTASLAQAGASLAVGVEVSLETLARARRTYGASGAVFVAGDAGALPFADGVFDLVACFEVVEHLLRPRKLLEEARRTLGEGGTAVVSTPNRLVSGSASRFHVVEYAPDEYAALVRAAFPDARVVPQRSLALSEVQGAEPDLDGADYLVAVTPAEAVERAGSGRVAVRLAEVEREFQGLLDHYVDLVARVDADRANLRGRLGEVEQQLAGAEADRGNLRELQTREAAERLGVEADRDALRGTLAGVEADRANLRQILEGVEADRSNLRELVTGVEADRANLRELLAGVEAERDRLRAAAADLEQRLAAAEGERGRLEGELDAVGRDFATVLGSRSWRMLRALGIVRR